MAQAPDQPDPENEVPEQPDPDVEEPDPDVDEPEQPNPDVDDPRDAVPEVDRPNPDPSIPSIDREVPACSEVVNAIDAGQQLPVPTIPPQVGGSSTSDHGAPVGPHAPTDEGPEQPSPDPDVPEQPNPDVPDVEVPDVDAPDQPNPDRPALSQVCTSPDRAEQAALTQIRTALLTAPVTVWTSLNQGEGSGMNADMVDGLHADDLLTPEQGDERYLGAEEQAVDSDRLDGEDSSAFARAGHDHDDTYLGVDDQATDSDQLDGLDSDAFARAGHDHDDRYYTKAEADERFVTEVPDDSDADTLDGLEADQFLRSDTSDTMNGDLDVDGDVEADTLSGPALNGVSQGQALEWGTKRISGANSGEIGDYKWKRVDFDEGYASPPLVFCNVQTERGGDDPRVCDVRNVGTSGFDLGFCEVEDARNGRCDSHATETIGWIAIGPR
jgi:hypothetical protein